MVIATFYFLDRYKASILFCVPYQGSTVFTICVSYRPVVIAAFCVLDRYSTRVLFFVSLIKEERPSLFVSLIGLWLSLLSVSLIDAR